MHAAMPALIALFTISVITQERSPPAPAPAFASRWRGWATRHPERRCDISMQPNIVTLKLRRRSIDSSPGMPEPRPEELIQADRPQVC
jgi:hypothetical protein